MEPNTKDTETGVAQEEQELSEEELKRLHSRVWARDADYIHFDVKRTTAERIVGWLHEFASQCDSEGYTATGDHARAVAELLRREIAKEQDQ